MWRFLSREASFRTRIFPEGMKIMIVINKELEFRETIIISLSLQFAFVFLKGFNKH